MAITEFHIIFKITLKTTIQARFWSKVKLSLDHCSYFLDTEGQGMSIKFHLNRLGLCRYAGNGGITECINPILQLLPLSEKLHFLFALAENLFLTFPVDS